MRMRKVVALGLTTMMTVSMMGCGSTETSSNEKTGSIPKTETKATTEGETTTETSSNLTDVPTYAEVTLGEDYTDLTATIKFLHNATNRETDGTIGGFIEEFNKVYPNITVETEGVTDYAETALLRLPTGDWGDVMFIPTIDAVDLPSYFIPYGTVEEMDQFVNFAGNTKYEGMCYGVGSTGDAQGLLYNKAVFEAAGVTELPKTPDELMSALQAIKDNTDAIPLYTNYAAGWTMGGAWDGYLGAVTTGDTTWLNQKFVHSANPFADNGDGTGAYALYKILYDAVANDLIEEDYTTTDWEGCKGMINDGKIGCMVLGSWAIKQMKDAGANPDDIGYMPFPITVNGKQYATASAGYSYGISATTSKENQIASMVFVKWMVEESGWCEFEGGYPVSKTAETSFSFEGVEIVTNDTALDGEENLLNEMNSESELNFNNSGDARVQRIVEAAAEGIPYEELMAEWTEAWNNAQDTLGVDVTY